MFFRKNKLKEAEKKIEWATACLQEVLKINFLLVSADSAESLATIAAKEEQREMVEGYKKMYSQELQEVQEWQEAILHEFYAFCGEMTFKPLAGNANAVIAEIEKVLRDERLFTESKDWQDVIMASLLENFGDARKCSETQAEVMDYLCKRWNIDEDRRAELMAIEEKDIEAMSEKVIMEIAGD